VTIAVSMTAAEVRIGGRRILGPLDLEIATGEHWVLLGPNGSGKTTALTLIGARRQPSGGVVEILGSRLGRVDVRQLRPGSDTSRIGSASSCAVT
jgi:iron complex transport system ATP-binding protein